MMRPPAHAWLRRAAALLCAAAGVWTTRAQDVRIEADTSADRQPISPYLYGANLASAQFGPPKFPADAPFTWYRLGGNMWSPYNWESNRDNRGTDWRNLTTMDVTPGPRDALAGHSVRTAGRWVYGRGAELMITVQMLGRAAGNAELELNAQNAAAHSVRVVPFKNAPFTLVPDLEDGVVAMDEFLFWYRATFAADIARGRRVLVTLDNEPDNWADKHPLFHPDPVTFRSLLDKSVETALAVRSQMSRAVIHGPASVSIWHARLGNAPDANGRDFVVEYLRRMRDESLARGVRLLDVFTVHAYGWDRPAGSELEVDKGDLAPDSIAARVRATRSWWDPSYVENSWLTHENVLPSVSPTGNRAVMLLPRMRRYVDEHYPGTRLGITEFNFGADDHISGALANADAVGIGAREGLHTLCWWPLDPWDAPTDAFRRMGIGGFRMWRNYDNQGAAVGDLYVRTTVSNTIDYSAYTIAQSDDRRRLWMVILNKNPLSRFGRVEIRHSLPFVHGRVFQLTEAEMDGRPSLMGEVQPRDNAFDIFLPALSVITIELTTVAPGDEAPAEPAAR